MESIRRNVRIGREKKLNQYLSCFTLILKEFLNFVFGLIEVQISSDGLKCN